MTALDFWSDQRRAKDVIASANELKAWITPIEQLEARLSDCNELAKEIDDDDIELRNELLRELNALEQLLEELEIKRMLSRQFDKNNCFFSINAGAGGTESCDWVQMLSRMYQRWALKKGWKIETVDLLAGEVAGIKNVTFYIAGSFVYGYCKAEKGVHRLVRISPFDSSSRRHTSFASVDVVPEIDEQVDILISPDEIRIDTFRSSGAGGQHVNTTDSAVRITHIPTGIVVTCQGERSQLQNKENCFKMLKAKLYQRQLAERKQTLEKIGGEKKEISWGSQIRNYVLHPYRLVKDTRTQYEEGNVEHVLDGAIDPFVHRYLKEFGSYEDH